MATCYRRIRGYKRANLFVKLMTLRFAERMAGYSGFEYSLDYSEKALPTDDTFESIGTQIHIDKPMIGRLLGSEIDFIDGLQGSGFKISNPNVKSSCGCGRSPGY